MLAAAPACSPAADAYRRQARRLRCRYASEPVRMQRSLKALADRTPVMRIAAPSSRVVEEFAHEIDDSSIAFASPVRTGAARRFAGFLAMRMPDADLRYSERLALLRAARTFGVGRFEANLLIAAVLERRRGKLRERSIECSSPARRSMLSGVAVFLIAQSAIALGAWWTLLR